MQRPELLVAAKECREALASLMRAVYASQMPGPIIDAWEADLKELGIKDGFGKRLQEAIAKQEAGRAPAKV